jgi:hypothetical protein
MYVSEALLYEQKTIIALDFSLRLPNAENYETTGGVKTISVS